MQKNKAFREDYLVHNIRKWTYIAVGSFLLGSALTMVSGGVSFLIGVAVAGYAWKKRKIFRSGKSGETKVSKKLASILPKDIVILHDVAIMSNGRLSQIDHVVLGPGGAAVIETKNHGGTVFVDPNATMWRRVKRATSGRVYEDTLYSPVRQNYGHARALKKLLEQNGILGPILNIVVFASPDVRLEYLGDGMPVKTVGNLGRDDFAAIMVPRPKFSILRAEAIIQSSYQQAIASNQ